MKVVFMGTPDFAVDALEAIIEAGHEVTAVVTQPDKRKGRGKEMQFPPVKESAVKHQIPVFQPIKIKTSEAVDQLSQYEADIYVVAAFGQILSKEILDMPRLGCVNIHASLLPKYRGAAPIQWAILDGEAETGVTIMQMNEGLDTGDMLYKRAIPISDNDTGDSLTQKLARVGADLIVEVLPLLEKGKLIPEKQVDEDSCYAKMLKKSLGEIDWSAEGIIIERKIRGLNAWPSAYTLFNGKTLKIWDATVIEENTQEEAGTIIRVDKDWLYVATGKGVLQVKSLQLEGKKRMTTKEFLMGYKVQVGQRFGT